MNRTTQGQKRLPKLQQRIVPEASASDAVETLLALDRMVVELSLRVYKVPRRERNLMHTHHRRWHRAVRKHLPRLLQKV